MVEQHLVNKKTMEHGDFQWEIWIFLWPFSIVSLIYQRVFKGDDDTKIQVGCDQKHDRNSVSKGLLKFEWAKWGRSSDGNLLHVNTVSQMDGIKCGSAISIRFGCQTRSLFLNFAKMDG